MSITYVPLTEWQLGKLSLLVENLIKVQLEDANPSVDALASLFELRGAVKNLKPIPPKPAKQPSRRKASQLNDFTTALNKVTSVSVEDTSLGPQKGLVLAALAANAAHILNADQVAEITGLERRTASAYLSELTRSGKAVRAGHGRYAIAEKPTEEGDVEPPDTRRPASAAETA